MSDAEQGNADWLARKLEASLLDAAETHVQDLDRHWQAVVDYRKAKEEYDVHCHMADKAAMQSAKPLISSEKLFGRQSPDYSGIAAKLPRLHDELLQAARYMMDAQKRLYKD
jgi:hypothetical protein